MPNHVPFAKIQFYRWNKLSYLRGLELFAVGHKHKSLSVLFLGFLLQKKKQVSLYSLQYPKDRAK